MIRLAPVEELPLLREIEVAAGAPFRAIGMAAIADDEPPDPATLAEYRRAVRAGEAARGLDRRPRVTMRR